MDESQPPSSASPLTPPTPPAPSKTLFTKLQISPRLQTILAVSLVLLATAFAGFLKWQVNPAHETAKKRAGTIQDLLTLYDLQKSYKKAARKYANSPEALFKIAPNGAALKARMGEHLDLNTLTVVGDAKKFKLEANVLDEERTFFRMRGPFVDPASRPTRDLPEATSAASDSGGAPVR